MPKGQVYHRAGWMTAPDDTRVLAHKTGDWLTLITCRGYDPHAQTYHWRQVVQAGASSER